MFKAEDLWPLVSKLPREERIRLVRRALVADILPDTATDAERYRVMPVHPGEFDAGNDDPMAWEADGWEDVK